MSKANIAIHAQDKTGRAISSAKNNLASLQKRVGLVSSSFVKMIGVAGISALGVLSKRTIDSADNLSKLRDRLGASTEALSQYKHVAELSNVSFDTLTMGWQRMTRRVAEAAQGTGEAKNALRELGISAVELNKLKPEQQFEVLADAIKSVENPADKVRLAMKLFDSEGVSLIQTMKGGSEGIREMREEADRLGKTITDDMAQGAADANDAMTRLGASISGSFQSALINSSDSLGRLADWLSKVIPPLINGLIRAFEILGAVGAPVIALFSDLGVALFGSRDEAVKLSGVMESLSGLTGNQLKAQRDSIKARIKEIEGDRTLRDARGRLSEATQTELEGLKAKLPFVMQELSNSRVGIMLNVEEAESILSVARANVQEAKARAEKVKIGGMSRAAKVSLKRASKGLEKAEAALASQQEKLIKFDQRLRDAQNGVKDAMESNTFAAATLKPEVDGVSEATKNLAAEQEKLIAEYRESVSIYGKYADANELVFDTLLDVTKAEERRKGIIREVANLVESNGISQEKANKILAETGVLTEEVTDKQKDLGSTVTTVRGLWERANDSMFNSLQTFFSSGLKDTASFADSFKDTFTDMISSVLAEITRLIASNAFKKFLGLMGVGGSANQGVGIFDGLGAMFGGGESGGNSGIGGVGSAVSGITQLFSGLGGGASGTSGIAGIGRLLFGGGNTSAAGAVMPTSGIFGGAGLGSLGSSLSTIAAAIPYIALAAAVIESGGPILYRGVKELFSSGARSPQQLGLDQLQSLSDATKAGRNTQVQLGSVAGVGTSFLGGFDENSTFFGVDLVKEELQKVGDILANKFGFNQALALKDGVIRLEDFSRDFSENNERIVAEVQASILIAKKGFEDAELAKVAALGRSVIAMDRLYDQSASSGLSAADRLKEAYMGAFGASESAAMEALNNMGIGTEKLADIFDSSSNEILATLTGVSTEGLGLFGEGLAKVGENAAIAFDSIESRINATAQSVNSFQSAINTAQTSANERSRETLSLLRAQLEATQEQNRKLNVVGDFVQQSAAAAVG